MQWGNHWHPPGHPATWPEEPLGRLGEQRTLGLNSSAQEHQLGGPESATEFEGLNRRSCINRSLLRQEGVWQEGHMTHQVFADCFIDDPILYGIRHIIIQGSVFHFHVGQSEGNHTTGQSVSQHRLVLMSIGASPSPAKHEEWTFFDSGTCIPQTNRAPHFQKVCLLGWRVASKRTNWV